ncbi:MAG: hypothetical protein GX900_01335 [Clostridiaceae bacterium]|nr:hypothetical protein [Clostridiaceae bacterium]
MLKYPTMPSFVGKAGCQPNAYFDHPASTTPLVIASSAANAADSGSLYRTNGIKPRRMASWWCVFEDLLWPEKSVVLKIQRRAESFAKAGIDTAIIFGFHCRFDFANYFDRLHGYLRNVAEELHKYGIKLMDHYTCNIVERPRSPEEAFELHRRHRHHVLLYPDPRARAHQQYEGVFFNDICEIDVRTGKRSFAIPYTTESFCHNNPDFLEMHRRYLQRQLREIPLDGYQVDDMCMYAGTISCGCEHCRRRFKEEYGYEIPPYEDKSFWGEANEHYVNKGNYENPAFRAYIEMRMRSVADHAAMVRETIFPLQLMTCCSASGPIHLNSLALDLDHMKPHLDMLMLENCGLDIDTADWPRAEAEVMAQKDIAVQIQRKIVGEPQLRGLDEPELTEQMEATVRGERVLAPAVALSYTIYEDGAYLGWSLARFWGVGNWCSTLHGRLVYEPTDPSLPESSELVAPYNSWEDIHSPIDCYSGRDIVELRLVNNQINRLVGWETPADEAHPAPELAQGHQHWHEVEGWTRALIKHNIGYRQLRGEELADAEQLTAEDTPIVLAASGVISDAQQAALETYLAAGGRLVIIRPCGLINENYVARPVDLASLWSERGYPGLLVVGEEYRIHNLVADVAEKATSAEADTTDVASETDTATSADRIAAALVDLLVAAPINFSPVLSIVSEPTEWSFRLRSHPDGFVLHALNRGLIGEGDPNLESAFGNPGRILKSLHTVQPVGYPQNIRLRIDLAALRAALRTPDHTGITTDNLFSEKSKLISPEWDTARSVILTTDAEAPNDEITLTLDLTDTRIYAVVQGS